MYTHMYTHGVVLLVGNAECGRGGVCVPFQGDQAVPCHPWGVGALPPMPMATLDAEDDVHTTPYDTRAAIRTVEYGVGNAECGCGGVCVPSQGDQAVSCHPLGVTALPPMPHGDPRC
jgi:hypothetical protein